MTTISVVSGLALIAIVGMEIPVVAAGVDWQHQRYWAMGQYWSYSERYQNGYNEGVQDAQNNSPESCSLGDHTQIYCDGYHAGYISINNGNQQQQGQTQGQTQGQNTNSQSNPNIQSNPTIKIIINNNNTNNGVTSSNSTTGHTGAISAGGGHGQYHGSWGFTGPYCGYPGAYEPCNPPAK